MSTLIDAARSGLKYIYHDYPVEVLWTACIFASSIPYLYRNLTTKGWEMSRKAPTYTLIPHVLISVLEVIIYNFKQWQNKQDPLPTPLDLFLCMLQVSTALYLAEKQANVPKAAAPPLARAAFHAMVCQRLLASGLAACLGSAKWHRASIKVLHSFIWGRVLVAGARHLSAFETHAKAVTGGTVASGLGGMYEGSYPHGNAIWIGCMVGLLALDRLGQQFDKYDIEFVLWMSANRHSSVTRAFTTLGFVSRRNDVKGK
jgi:hypothetical protein